MTKNSYKFQTMSLKKNYINIYIWQLVSMTLNFLALFIVTPNISSMPEIYGVYSMCISLNVFLQYADLGFLKAGKKYAAECISTGDLESEQKYVGTSLIIYLLVCFCLLLGSVVCVLHPEFIIKGINDNPEILKISRKLLIIFMSSVPISVFEKFVSLIYSIRLLDFKIQRIQILGSIVKIISVPLVFFNNRYDIVGYYLFTQIVQLLCFAYIVYKSKEIGYGTKRFFEVLKFDKLSFEKMKGLAVGGFAASISWILFYELDTLAISAILGANAIAIYAIGRTLQTYIRTILGILYSPFDVRFNHFVGKSDHDGFLKFFYYINSIYSVVIIPIVIVAIFASPFIIAWVGPLYEESIIIAQLLVLCFGLNAISNPCTSIIYSYNKVKALLWISVLQPLFFWLGIIVTIKYVGVNSFAIFKLVGCLIAALYSYYISRKVLNISARKVLLNNFVWPLVLSVASVSAIYRFFVCNYCIDGKSYENLIIILLFMAVAGLVSFSFYFAFRPEFRKNIMSIIKS